MRKTGLREVKSLVQGHTAQREKNQGVSRWVGVWAHTLGTSPATTGAVLTFRGAEVRDQGMSDVALKCPQMNATVPMSDFTGLHFLSPEC